MTNYTLDLLFSMERLSQNPYPLRLIKPHERLPFYIARDVTFKVTGTSLEELRARGNLFYVDRKLHLPKPPGIKP